MSTYKPAKSRYYHYDFQWKGHRFHGTTGCRAKRDADRYEAEVRRKAALGELERRPITLDEAGGRWWRAKGKAQRSAATTKGQLLRLVTRLGKTVMVDTLTLEAIDRYVAWRRAFVKNASVNRELELLRRIINWCGKRGYSVPEIDWQELMLKEPPTKTRVLSFEEEKRLLAKLPDNLKPIVLFALMSGQRKSEVVRLRWSDVDFINMRATIPTKGDQLHSFPLTEAMVALINAQPRAAAQVFTYVAERSAPKRKDRPARIRGERYPFSPQGWSRKWRKAREEAGLDDFRFHDLRHTAASRLDLETAFELLGHSDIRTTMRYFHTAEDRVREAMRAAESRNSPEPQEGVVPVTRRKAANDG